jgi:hypothetical protein
MLAVSPAEALLQTLLADALVVAAACAHHRIAMRWSRDPIPGLWRDERDGITARDAVAAASRRCGGADGRSLDAGVIGLASRGDERADETDEAREKQTR